jgi:hypothetical protein
MSLTKIAQYLEHQGRGDDKHLVHMTKGELQALQKLAEQNGGSLTINPQTGLPEAGFLSSILPMVAGAAMVALAPATGGLSMLGNPLVAGAIVGAGSYAMTGSLQQGVMAGLSAYGGGALAGGLGAIGAGATDVATSTLANEAGNVAGQEAVKVAAAQGITDQAALNAIQQQAIDSGANAVGQVASPKSLASIGGGLSNPSGTGITQSLSNLGSFAKNNVGALAGLGLGAYQAFQDSNKSSEPETDAAPNPFGLKTIPKDANGNPIFKPSLPTPPAQPYQAQYRNYVQNPYNPMSAKSGGLMDVPKYAGKTDYGSMVSGAKDLQQGLSQASQAAPLTPLQEQLIAMGQRSSQEGLYNLSDIEYAKLSPKELMKKHKIDIAKGLSEVGALGAYDTKSATQLQAEAAAQADIAKSQSRTSAKEGGLMAFAEGGSPIYHPQYQNFAPTAYQQRDSTLAQLQAENQAYMNQGIPEFSRLASNVGYAIDPMQMKGSPALQAFKADEAAKLAATNLIMQQQQQMAGYGSNQNTGDGMGDDGGGTVGQGMGAGGEGGEGGDGGASGGNGGSAFAIGGGIGSDYGVFADNSNSNSGMDQFHRGQQYPMQQPQNFNNGGSTNNLGGYSDGGRLLKGPGDGVSDGIPATINGRQPARLADGEFVIPARIVSELGNGSTDAGAKRLYAMMDRIKSARSKAKNIATDTKAYKHLPA